MVRKIDRVPLDGTQAAGRIMIRFIARPGLRSIGRPFHPTWDSLAAPRASVARTKGQGGGTSNRPRLMLSDNLAAVCGHGIRHEVAPMLQTDVHRSTARMLLTHTMRCDVM
jgi:hypothetical protein